MEKFSDMKKQRETSWLRRGWDYLDENVEDFSIIVATAVLLLVMVLVFYAINPRFLSVPSIRSIGVRASYYLIAAVGMTIVLTVGGIDISVGSIVGVCAVTLGISLAAMQLPLVVGLALCLAVGAILGSFNGFLVAKVRVPPIVVTLGSLTLFRGIAHLVAGGDVYFRFPASFAWFGAGEVFGFFPVPILIAAIAVIWGHVFLKSTRSGRHITAVGGNEEAARMAGIKIVRHRFLPFLISGIMMAIATIVMVSRISAAQATQGQIWEIRIITSAVLGGTSVFGGRGVVLGTVLGALILGALESGLVMARVADFWQLAAVGLLFVLVVTVRTATGQERAR